MEFSDLQRFERFVGLIEGECRHIDRDADPWRTLQKLCPVTNHAPRTVADQPGAEQGRSLQMPRVVTFMTASPGFGAGRSTASRLGFSPISCKTMVFVQPRRFSFQSQDALTL